MWLLTHGIVSDSMIEYELLLYSCMLLFFNSSFRAKMLKFDLLVSIANNEFSNTLSEVSVFKVLESKQVKYHGTSFEHGIE